MYLEGSQKTLLYPLSLLGSRMDFTVLPYWNPDFCLWFQIDRSTSSTTFKRCMLDFILVLSHLPSLRFLRPMKRACLGKCFQLLRIIRLNAGGQGFHPDVHAGAGNGLAAAPMDKHQGTARIAACVNDVAHQFYSYRCATGPLSARRRTDSAALATCRPRPRGSTGHPGPARCLRPEGVALPTSACGQQ